MMSLTQNMSNVEHLKQMPRREELIIFYHSLCRLIYMRRDDREEDAACFRQNIFGRKNNGQGLSLYQQIIRI